MAASARGAVVVTAAVARGSRHDAGLEARLGFDGGWGGLGLAGSWAYKAWGEAESGSPTAAQVGSTSFFLNKSTQKNKEKKY